MADHTAQSGYTKLVERLNRFPQGAPPGELLYSILKILFSEVPQSLCQMPFTNKIFCKSALYILISKS